MKHVGSATVKTNVFTKNQKCLPQQLVNAGCFGNNSLYCRNWHAFLLQRIAVANGNGVVGKGIKIYGYAVGGTYGILPSVAAANGIFLIVLALNRHFEF